MKARESDILRACLDLLAAERILAFRMNVGVAQIGNRVVRYGVPGMADILAFVSVVEVTGFRYIIPLWIECKTERGRQRMEQKSFETQVREQDHSYLIARSSDDLKERIERLRAGKGE